MDDRIKSLLKRALPNNAVSFLVFVRGLRQKVRSYSQYGEDLIVSSYFKQRNITNGTYLDIGAFHPIWLSNTYVLHKQGWTGHVVDVDRTKVWSFKLLRNDKVKTYCAAITPAPSESGTVNLYKFIKPWSELDTLSFEEAEGLRGTGETYYKTIIASLALNDLLARIGKINFLNIDIEGLDEALLMSMEFGPNSPELIVFEDNRNWGGSDKVIMKLQSSGYKHLFTSGGSVGYCLPPTAAAQ